MANRIIAVFFLWMALLAAVHAQDKLLKADSLMHQRGEVYVGMAIDDLTSSGNLVHAAKIDRIKGDTAYLYLGRRDREFLSANLERLNLLNPPSEKFRVKMSSAFDEVLQGKAYPTYAAYLQIMDRFAAEYPSLCRIDTIGRSVENRLILAARLGTEDPSLPVAFFTSSIHGDETAGFSLMLRLIDSLLVSSAASAGSGLLSELNVIINPLSNPDGTYFSSDTSVYGATRFNAAGVDLNRNFPDPASGDHPDGNEWQPETVSMMEYMDEHKPHLSANFHGGAELVNYPYDTWAYLHADEDWFQFISEEYASQARLYRPGYLDDFGDGVVRGFIWYEVDGGRQDYVTYFLHGRELTIELSDVKLPPDTLLDDYWQANRNPLIDLLQQATYGIRGEIRDSASNDPVVARIFINDHDKLNSDVSSDSTGYFFRPLYEGTYSITVSAEGYKDYFLENQVIENYAFRHYNIPMSRDRGDPVAGPGIDIRPNPFTDHLIIKISYNSEASLELKIYDLKGKLVHSSLEHLHEGLNEVIITPEITDQGLYILDLKAPGLREKRKIVRIP